MADTDFDAVAGSLNNNFYDYDDLTSISLVQENTTFTAPSDGLLCISVGGSGTPYPIIRVKNSLSQEFVVILAQGWVNTNVPLKRGQTIIIQFENRVGSYNCQFVPLVNS